MRGFVDVDADREGVDQDAPVQHRHAAVVAGLAAEPRAAQRAEEVLAVLVGLEADHVELCQRAQQVPVARQRAQHVETGEGHVEEEADRLLDAGAAQLLRQRNQMVVMHPDEVVRLQQREQLACEQRVDATVRLVGITIVAEEAEQVVEQRPQRAVAEVVVVAVEIGLVEVDGGEGDVAVLLQLRIRGSPWQVLPPQPNQMPPLWLQRGEDADGEAAGGLAARGRGNPVGNGDQAAQNASSHGLLSRMAPRMMPTRL